MEALFSPPLALRDVDVGGGRGVFATAPIRAGTVVLAELAVLEVPQSAREGETLHVALARAALACGDLLGDSMAQLHPKTLASLSAEQLAECRERHAAAAERVAADAGVDRNHALLFIFKMEFNAYTSGLYLRKAMVNHACLPNCASFGHKGAEGGSWSELVAVRDISPGEEITIAYLSPPERSHGCRRAALREQHLFELGPSPFPEPCEELRWGPGCTNAGAAVASRAEAEAAVATWEARIDKWEQVEQAETSSARERFAALEEAEARLSELCGPRHLALARVRQSMLRVCSAEESIFPDRTARASCALRLALDVMATQELYLGADHCERASTLGDAANALRSLLEGRDGAQVLSTRFGHVDWACFLPDADRACSAVALARRVCSGWEREALRLQRLYEEGKAALDSTPAPVPPSPEPAPAAATREGDPWDIFV